MSFLADNTHIMILETRGKAEGLQTGAIGWIASIPLFVIDVANLELRVPVFVQPRMWIHTSRL